MVHRIAILGTRYPDFAIEEEVLGSMGVEIVSAAGGDADEIEAAAATATVIVAGSRPQFTREVLQRLSGCRAIVRSGIGVDSVDLPAASDFGIMVVNVPDYGTEAVAQHTLALALAGTRRLVEGDLIVKSGGWGFPSLRPLHLPNTMTAGVVGFGRIGRRVADLLVSVGFGRVLACDAWIDPEGPNVEASSLDELLSTADLVTLHAPGPANGRPLLGHAELARMRQGSVLVNTARGSLIDSSELAVALARGAPRIAALDVYTPEPPDLDILDPVRDRLVLTPHMAWYSEETQSDLRRKSAEEARRILTGETPLHLVALPKEDK